MSTTKITNGAGGKTDIGTADKWIYRCLTLRASLWSAVWTDPERDTHHSAPQRADLDYRARALLRIHKQDGFVLYSQFTAEKRPVSIEECVLDAGYDAVCSYFKLLGLGEVPLVTWVKREPV